MIEISPSEITDLEIIKDFQIKMAWQTEALKLEEDVLHAGILAVFKDSSKGTYYVAREEGKIIGCLLVTPEWSEWRNGTVLWIQSVYIEENYRGKGVFKKMYNYLKDLVHSDKKLMGLRLYVEKTNIPAQKVYEAIGMNGEHYHFFEWMKVF